LKQACRMVLGLAVLLLWNGTARAQIAMYGQATGASLQTLGTSHIYGGTFGFYDTRQVGPISIGPDIRGAILETGGSQGANSDQVLDMGQLGLRVAGHLHGLPLMPYAEGMFGLGYWRGGVGVLRQDTNHFMVQAIAGLDYRLTHRFDWRVAEFTYGRAGAMPGFIHPMTLSTGIVLQIK
jgi:hypothetical protein